VVIAIIAILAAILFPVFARAREKARTNSCLNNQRQIAVAAMMYVQDHEETFFPDPGHAAWSSYLKAYNEPSIYDCPTKTGIGNNDKPEYALNKRLCGTALGDVSHPAEMCLIADAKPGITLGRFDPDLDERHNGMVVAAFVDGHTEVRKAAGTLSLTRNPKDGAELVHIPRPASAFTRGGAAPGQGAPAHQVTLTQGYYLYKYEVTVGQYKAFCAATGRTMPVKPFAGWSGTDATWYQDTTYDRYPIVRVKWDDATAYADWAEAALPTEAQWEHAARGMEGRSFTWGNTWDGSKCANSIPPYSLSTTQPVGSYPAGVSWCGAHDLNGNAAEWCADWHAAYTAEAKTDPLGPDSGTHRVQRGGSYGGNSQTGFNLVYRSGQNPNTPLAELGFRCVLAAPEP